jgi:hypothetical protein
LVVATAEAVILDSPMHTLAENSANWRRSWPPTLSVTPVLMGRDESGTFTRLREHRKERLETAAV